jgi:SAM-dependent methyltransferase
METSAVEITDSITVTLRQRMQGLGIPTDIRTGQVGDLPFADEVFDYLLSWNSCYDMSFGGMDFQQHVDEMARVLKPGAWIVASIPKNSSFIFHDSVAHSVPGYRVIQNDYFNARDGEVMRCMASRYDLEQSFAAKFEDFCHADLDMEWFGLSYRWHVFAAQRRA